MSREIRIDRLLPGDIDDALRKRSIVYVPLGTYEWHGQHLPIGLDALTAFGVCRHAALIDGGLVCPTLYYGAGGGHARYPWTVMMDDESAISTMLLKTLQRMQDFGVQLIVLFSGHFAPLQLDMIERLAADWNAARPAMRVVALAVSMAPDMPIKPDHAGLFETSLLHALHPDLVDIDRLPPLEIGALAEADAFGDQRHAPEHPLYGIFGPDPRAFQPAETGTLLRRMVAWVIDEVRIALPVA